MATLASLEEQKRELEEKLNAGDLSVEPALARIDRAIMARTRTIQHSKKRLDAVRKAVAAGVPVDEARRRKTTAGENPANKARRKNPLNRF